MATVERIEDTEEAWDTGQLGEDERFVAAVEDFNHTELDEALGLKMISIRLEKDLIEDFKNIASYRGGLGYQTLMRQVLKRFADCEKKQILKEAVAAKRAAEELAAMHSAAVQAEVKRQSIAVRKAAPAKRKKAA